MLSSYPVTCPYENCGWTGNLVPSHIQGGVGAEIASREHAWFQCPSCRRDWEVQIMGDRVRVLAVPEQAR